MLDMCFCLYCCTLAILCFPFDVAKLSIILLLFHVLVFVTASKALSNLFK